LSLGAVVKNYWRYMKLASRSKWFLV